MTAHQPKCLARKPMSGARRARPGLSGPTYLLAALLTTLALPVFADLELGPPTGAGYYAQDIARVFRSGKVEDARELFRGTLEIRFSNLTNKISSLPQSATEVAHKASFIGPVHGLLNEWESEEMKLRLETGTPTREAVLSDIVEGATALVPYARTIRAWAQDLVDLRDVKLARRTFAKFDHVGQFLVRTTVFLRGTNRDQQREELYSLAKLFIELPETLDEFDAENDVYDFFNKPQSHQEPAQPVRVVWTQIDASHPVYKLIMDLYNSIGKGDVQHLRSLFTEDAWDEEAISEATGEFAGYRVDSLGEVKFRDIGDSEFEVELRGIVIVDPQGSVESSVDQLIVRKLATGEYRIAYGSSKADRDSKMGGQQP